MKKTISLFALLTAAMLCAGALAGCAEETTETDDSSVSSSSSSSDSDVSTTQTEDVIGQVTYVSDSYLTLDVYEPDTEISDYASLDSVTLSDTGSTDSVYLDTDAVIEYAASGYLLKLTMCRCEMGISQRFSVSERLPMISAPRK